MLFKNFLNLKIVLISIFISVLLSLLSTYFYNFFLSGKSIISARIIENHTPKTFVIFENLEKNGFFSDYYAEIRLENLINNIILAKKNRIDDFDNEYNITRNICDKNLSIEFVKKNKKIFFIQVAGKANDIDKINSCILDIHKKINNSIQLKLDTVKRAINEVISSDENLLFIRNYSHNEKTMNAAKKLYSEDWFNENPVLLDSQFETKTIKITSTKIFFVITFLCYLLILLAIFNRKRIFRYLKN
jgi:hypothetical protein